MIKIVDREGMERGDVEGGGRGGADGTFAD